MRRLKIAVGECNRGQSVHDRYHSPMLNFFLQGELAMFHRVVSVDVWTKLCKSFRNRPLMMMGVHDALQRCIDLDVLKPIFFVTVCSAITSLDAPEDVAKARILLRFRAL